MGTTPGPANNQWLQQLAACALEDLLVLLVLLLVFFCILRINYYHYDYLHDYDYDHDFDYAYFSSYYYHDYYLGILGTSDW